MKVLVADDSAALRTMVRSALLRLGHECLLAADGLEAWERFLSDHPDVIISDWVMPGLEGSDLCRRVRGHEAGTYAYTYFIFLTMLEDKQHAVSGMRVGADDYLSKPLSLHELQVRLIAANRVTALHHELGRQMEERERTLARREALLRFARSLSAEGDPERLADELISQALLAVGGDSAVLYRWDEDAGRLRVARQHDPAALSMDLVALGQGVVGMAAQRRTPVVVHQYATQENVIPTAAAGGVQAAIGAPLVHEGRLLGALGIGTMDAARHFGKDDAEALELLAGLASASIIGLERARLDGARLTARTAEHELNNRLALTCGYAELLATHRELPDPLRTLAWEAYEAARAAAIIVQQLPGVAELHETQWGSHAGSTIDLARSLD